MDSPTSHNLSDNISKSSLVSLKAELLRKQQEIKKLQNESKNTSSGIVNCAKYRDKPITKLNINDKTNKNVTQRNDKDLKSQPNTIEETEELKHSQDALVAKTKIYDDLMKGKKVLDSSNQVLVNFDEKLKEKCDSDDDCVESQDNGDSDDEWTEFTDALGRTRKCLKEDLKFYQAQNRYLKETKCSTGANEHTGKLDAKGFPSVGTSSQAPPPTDAELLSFDMKRELLRKQWEEQEQKLTDKSNVHYQDILFGEARQHGVGYFGFSSDETERARQIETLNEMRDTTRLERDKVRQMRRLRRRQFKTRLRATENRKRESQGLPPLPASPDTSSSDEDKAEHEADVARTQSMVSDLVARKLEEIRRANKTREWDVGKDGQMSQEEWVEKQRAQRRAEFAPPESLIGLIGEEGKVGGQRGSAPSERSVSEEVHEEEKFGAPRGFAPRERSISGEGEPPRARRSREARSGEFEDAPRMSAEQMLARMEAEEAYSAGSIFCFKRKWAERNKQVFKRYQRTEGQSGGGTTSIGDSGKKCDRSGGRSFPKYEGRGDSRKPVTYPLVDTRFVANKDVFAKVEKPCANSDEGENNNERENTDNTCKRGNTDNSCKRGNIDERRKSSSSMSKSQNNDERKNSDNIKNTIESVGPLIPIIPEESTDKNEDLIGPPIPAEFSKPTPTPKPTTPKTTITPALKTTTTTTTTKPPLVPKAKPLVPTSQRFPWRYQKLSISSSPSTVAKTDSAKTDSTKTDSVKTDSTKTDSVKTDSMKTDSAKTDSVKTSSPSNPETTEMRNNDSTDKLNSRDKLDGDLTDELQSSDLTEKLESRGSNERLKSSESTNEPNCDVGALIGEKQNSSDSIGEKQNSPDTISESSGDSTGGPSTNFNFVNAKNKATSLKRKLDRSNVEFDATGRIVSKTRFRSQPNTPEPFRSQSITPEANPGNGRSTKGVEIAPPSTFEYFGPSRAGFGLSRTASKRGRAGNRMMDAVRYGMTRVEEKKKEKGEKKEKGLLDII